MNSYNIFNSKNIKTIVIFALIGVIFGLAVSAWQTPKFQASAKMLVVFKQDKIDAYSAAQSSNYLTGILSEAIYSSSFIDQVFKSNFDLKDTLGVNADKRLKNWKQMIKTKNQENKGIIVIDVLNSDKDQAEKFAQAVVYTLINKNSLYHGAGDQVEVRLIDGPSVKDQWAQPNIPQNSLLGLVAGLIIGLTLIVIFPEQRLFALIIGGREAAKSDETMELYPAVENVTEQFTAQPDQPADNSDTQSDPRQFYNW